jgi:hypothetical protein
MQNPTTKTTIPRCLHLATYSTRMLDKFPSVPGLVAAAAKMGAAAAALEQANDAYEQSKVAIVEARVDVKFADLTTDIELQKLFRRVELADGKAGGPLSKAVAPNGKTALVKPFGKKQLGVLINLHGALQSLVPTWAGAAQEATVVDGLRESYLSALDARESAWQSARSSRVARNLAKEAFIKAYLEVSFSVKALYPQDGKMQDLFFDEVENEVEKELGDEPAPPAGGAEPPDGGRSPA